MPKPDDEAFEADRRSRRSRADDEDRPRRPRPEEDEEERPRRRRRPRDDEDDGDDGIAVLIPYKNGRALAAYYCGVFALIPCVGLILGPIAFIFGILGLRYAHEHPRARGTGHAIAGIVLGGLVFVAHVAIIVVFAIAAASHRR
jgi:hypothetical protein